ncbi:hypothetical protein [Streptomyces glaucus]|uniref:Secreted protein n=1 Tax=Streptomyces glaucus TaxID=284029 RepID=A0ABP5WR39_9ACTN
MNKHHLAVRGAAALITALGIAAAAGATLPAAAAAAPPHRAASGTASAQAEPHPELDGLRIRAAGSADVYLVLDGRRHLVPSPVTYTALFGDSTAVRLVLTTDNISDGGALTAYAHLARSTDSTDVHLVSNGSKRLISGAALDRYGFDTTKVRTTYPDVLAALPSAAPLV